METPKGIQTILSQLLAGPSLKLARQLEQQLADHGYRKMVFGRVNQKASIEAASEGDRGVVERLEVFTEPADATRAAEICLNFDKALRLLERNKTSRDRSQ